MKVIINTASVSIRGVQNGIHDIYIPGPDDKDERNTLIKDEAWNPSQHPYLLITLQGTSHHFGNFKTQLAEQVGINITYTPEQTIIKTKSGLDSNLYLIPIIGKDEVLKYLNAVFSTSTILSLEDDTSKKQLSTYQDTLKGSNNWLSKFFSSKSIIQIDFTKLRKAFFEIHGSQLDRDDMEEAEKQTKLRFAATLYASEILTQIWQREEKLLKEQLELYRNNKVLFANTHTVISYYVDEVIDKTKESAPENDQQRRVLLHALEEYLKESALKNNNDPMDTKLYPAMVKFIDKVWEGKKEEKEAFLQCYKEIITQAKDYLYQIQNQSDAIAKGKATAPWQEAVHKMVSEQKQLLQTAPMEDNRDKDNNNSSSKMEI